jgi:hypothetical protein
MESTANGEAGWNIKWLWKSAISKSCPPSPNRTSARRFDEFVQSFRDVGRKVQTVGLHSAESR